MKDYINFSQNWNGKLYNNSFTTFRVNKPYYETGKEYEIRCKELHLFDAVILDKKVMKLDTVSEWITRLDADLPLKEFVAMMKKMYSKKYSDIDNLNFCLLLLKKIDK